MTTILLLLLLLALLCTHCVLALKPHYEHASVALHVKQLSPVPHPHINIKISCHHIFISFRDTC